MDEFVARTRGAEVCLDRDKVYFFTSTHFFSVPSPPALACCNAVLCYVLLVDFRKANSCTPPLKRLHLFELGYLVLNAYRFQRVGAREEGGAGGGPGWRQRRVFIGISTVTMHVFVLQTRLIIQGEVSTSLAPLVL